MKVKVKRAFQIQIDSRTVKTYEPGVYDVDRELAEKMIRFGKAEKVLEKVAPENKVVSAPETKEGDSGGTGAKPRKRGRPRKSS